MEQIKWLQEEQTERDMAEDQDPYTINSYGSPNVYSRSTGVNDSQILENYRNYSALYDKNLYLRFASLYDNNMLASAVTNKVHSLVWRDGWTLAPNEKEDLSESEFEEMIEFWEENFVFFRKFILEGLVTGTTLIEPIANEFNERDVMLAHISVGRVAGVKMDAQNPTAVKLTQEPTVQQDPYNSYETEATETSPNTTTHEIIQRTLAGFEGDLFFHRYNYRLNDRFGKSIMYYAENEFNGFKKVFGNTISRSQVMQMLSWKWSNFQPIKGDAVATKARQEELRALANGTNQIVFPKDGEDVESITPDVRALDLPAFISSVLEVCLAWYNFPPSLFGLPQDQNRATLEEADKAYIQKYTDIQGEYASSVQQILDYVASVKFGRYIKNCVEIQLPPIVTQDLQSRITDKSSQITLLQQLYEAGIITSEAYRTQTLIVMNGGEITLEETDTQEPPPPEREENENGNSNSN